MVIIGFLGKELASFMIFEVSKVFLELFSNLSSVGVNKITVSLIYVKVGVQNSWYLFLR